MQSYSRDKNQVANFNVGGFSGVETLELANILNNPGSFEVLKSLLSFSKHSHNVLQTFEAWNGNNSAKCNFKGTYSTTVYFYNRSLVDNGFDSNQKPIELSQREYSGKREFLTFLRRTNQSFGISQVTGWI